MYFNFTDNAPKLWQYHSWRMEFMVALQIQCSVLCSFEGISFKVLNNIWRFVKGFFAFFLGFYKGMLS